MNPASGKKTGGELLIYHRIMILLQYVTGGGESLW